MGFGAAKILCIEPYLALLESRCAILKYSGYDAVSASPQLAEIMLRGHKLDLIVLSNLGDSDLHNIMHLADGANVLVLYEITLPSELLSLVAIASSVCSVVFPLATTKHSWLS